MPTPYSTPLFPAPSWSTSILNKNKINKAPIYNPYDKFSQVEFDDWIGGITGALRRALGEDGDLSRSVPSDTGAHLLDSDSEVVMGEDADGIEDKSELGEDSLAEVRTRRDKGKARDPREGPGLGGRNQPIELLYSDADSGSEDVSRLDDEGEYEYGDDDSQGYGSAEYDSDGNRYASDDDEFEGIEEGEEEYDLSQPSNHRLNGEENGDDDEIIELSGEEGSVDGYNVYSPRSSPPTNDDEAPRTYERYSPQLDELKQGDGHGVEDDTEFDGGYDRFASDSTIQGSSLPQKIEDKQIIEEGGDSIEDFPPREESPQPVKLVDPWIGPQTYAEDFYNGGDVREGVLDPTIISSIIDHNQDTDALESPKVIEVYDQADQSVLDPPTSLTSSDIEMEASLLDSSLITDQGEETTMVEVDRGQPHEVIEVGDDSNVAEKEQKRQSAGRESEGENISTFAMLISTPTPEESLHVEVLEGNEIQQYWDQGGVVVESQTESHSVDLEDSAVVDVDALIDIEELNVDVSGNIEELVVADIEEPAEVYFLGYIDKPVAGEEKWDQSATRLNDPQDGASNVERDLNEDVIMEGAGQSGPKVAGDNTRSGQVDAEPTRSKDTPKAQLDEVSGDNLGVSRVEQDYESERPSPYQVPSQPTGFRDPWIGPETYTGILFNNGDMGQGVPDSTAVSPPPIGISPEPEHEHTRRDKPKFLPSSLLAIDSELEESWKDEDPLTPSPPGDSEAEGGNTERSTHEDQRLETDSDNPVEQYTESQRPAPEVGESLTHESMLSPVDGTRSSPTVQSFPPTFPEGELTSAPGHIVKSSSSMNEFEALDRKDEVDQSHGGSMAHEKTKAEITTLVYEGYAQEKDVEGADAVEFLASEGEDDDLHREGHFSSELTMESLYEGEESEPLAEVPIPVDSSTAQGDTPQKIHEVPTGVLSGAKQLAELPTDNVNTLSDNNAVEDQMEDEVEWVSQEESSPEGSLYEVEDDDEDIEDDEIMNAGVDGGPKKKKVKSPPLSEYQRNTLLSLAAQDQFPSKAQREEFAQQFGISPKRIQIWFRNYRMRSGKKRADFLHPTLQSPANLGTLTVADIQQEGAATEIRAAAHPTTTADITSNLSAGPEMTNSSWSPTTSHPTLGVESATSTSQNDKSAKIEDDPFILVGSSNLAAPGTVEEAVTLEVYSSTSQRQDALPHRHGGEAGAQSKHNTAVVAANDFDGSEVPTRRVSSRRTSSRHGKVEREQRTAPKRKRSLASSGPTHLTRAKSTKTSGEQSPNVSRKGKSKALVQDEEDDHREEGRTAASASENESESSGASAASKMLITSRSTSRASSLVSNTASAEVSTTAYSVPQSPTVSRWRDPLRAPILFHNHSGLIQFDRSGVPTDLSQDGSSSQPRNPPQRTAPTSNSPVTRSMCRFHRISLPRYEDGPRIFFILPGCSLGNRTLMKEEDIVDHGDATTLDHEVMIGDIESIEFSADPNDPFPLSQSASAQLVGVLRHLVGVDLLRENEVFFLPQPGENYRRKRHGKSKSLANKLSYGDISSPRTFRASKSSPSVLRPPPSAAGSTSTTTNSTPSRRMGSTSSSAALRDDAKIDGDDCGASSSHHTTSKKTGGRGQTWKRSSKMSVDFQEYDPAEEPNQCTDHEEGESRRSKRRQGVKRSWTESNGEVPLPSGKRRLRARPSAP